MINITRKGTVVLVNITTDLCISDDRSPGAKFTFILEAQSAACAELLSDHLRQRLAKIIKEVRKAEYEAGWKAAKSKSKKRNWGRNDLARCASDDFGPRKQHTEH